MMEAPSISGAVFADLFGSDSESEQHVADSIQHIHEVPGLCIYKEWIPEEEQVRTGTVRQDNKGAANCS